MLLFHEMKTTFSFYSRFFSGSSNCILEFYNLYIFAAQFPVFIVYINKFRF